MPENIGKYEVIERIGRGGMGMIFKAHDPVLDRRVALKLISSDVEVTDELRARFFREAQACARLSHPNIVTIYDMGEHDGRLYIVMELLDGEELRHLIAQRKPLELEDKLSVMLQVCDGLHYAHQRGIVHRDIKPANIFLLRNGRVKILDFGIARVGTTEAGLTRTGLIMGTLRYISPEQVRGQASTLSDIFSVGAVFYEFLSLRAPFTGDDPMNLLEQLRSADPPSLREVDPAIPPELADAVERALQKDPAQRFTDLEQMRLAIEAVQRSRREQAERVRRHLRDQRQEIVQLQRALTDRIGVLPESEALPNVESIGHVAALHAIEHDFEGRIEALHKSIARADALAPVFARGTDLLHARQFADAAVQFEAIVAEMPEHAHAREELDQARAAEAQRREQLTARLLGDARAAFDQNDCALCLEHLKRAAEVPPPAAMLQEIASLRRSAEARLAAEEMIRQERQGAERAREQMAEARSAAHGEEASRYASALWADGEVKAAEAQTHLAQGSYAQARQVYERAEQIYRRGLEAARETRVREQESAQHARDRMTRALQEAEAAHAPQYARDLWEAAEAKATEGRAAFDRQSLGHAGRFFDEAALLYGRAGEAAHAGRDRLRQRAEQAQSRAVRGRQTAAEAGAERDAASRWAQAVAKLADADTSLQRESFTSASRAFGEAELLFRQAESEAGEAAQRRRLHAEQAREGMEEARDRAIAAGAAALVAALWSEAETARTAAETALTSEAYAEAAEHFDGASARYAEATTAAREAVRQRNLERAAAESEHETALAARRTALEARASQYAATEWSQAEDAAQRASAAMSGEEHSAARALFREARDLYNAAAVAASAAMQDETRRVEAMMVEARRLLESAEPAGCLLRLNAVFVLRPGHPPAESLRTQAEAALRQTETSPLAESAPTLGIETGGRSGDATARPPAAGHGVSSREVLTGDATLGGQARYGDATLLSPPHGDAEPQKRDTSQTSRPAVIGVPDEVGASATASGATSRVPAETTAFRHTDSGPFDDATIVAGPLGGTGQDSTARVSPASPITRAEAANSDTRARDRSEASGNRMERPGPMDGPDHAPLPRGLIRAPGTGRTALPEIDKWLRARPRGRLGVRIAAIGAGALALAVGVFFVSRPSAPPTPPARSAPASTRPSLQPTPTPPAQSAPAPQKSEAPAPAASATNASNVKDDAQERDVKKDGNSTVGDNSQPGVRERGRQENELPKASGPRSRTGADAGQETSARQASRVTSPPPQTGHGASAPSTRPSASKYDVFLPPQTEKAAPSRTGTSESPSTPQQTPRQTGPPATQQVAAPRTDADQAQARMVAARRAAEQAGASFYAPKLLASARVKEQDAAAAASRSDFALASRLFGDAQSDYQTAALESKREADAEWQQVLTLKSSAEQSRARASSRRDAAVKAEADRLNRDLFDGAQAKQSDGDALFGQQNFQAAALAYQEAAERYLEATIRAQGVREGKSQADAARAQMRTQKQRASSSAPEFGVALAEEKQGDSLYDRLAFREAAEKFRLAETLFSRATQGTAAPPPKAAEPSPSRPRSR